jgi:hypothetical protein
LVSLHLTNLWFVCSQQGDVLSHLGKEHARYEQHLRNQYALSAPAHKFAAINGGGSLPPPPPQPPLAAYSREDPTAAGQPLRPFPPLHPRGHPGNTPAAAAYALHGGGNVASPRPPPMNGPSPPKLLSPFLGKTPANNGVVRLVEVLYT